MNFLGGSFNISELRHPSLTYDSLYWPQWRECYSGGDEYTRLYLKKFSAREDNTDFAARQEITPTATFAKAAVNDIRNAIFQRMTDIIRRGGSKNYMAAIAGEEGGVDLRGSTMGYFMGVEVLTELLVMGRTGVYVDAPQLRGPTLADVGGARPYIYRYQIEDILAWTASEPEDPSAFQAVLLRDRGVDFTQDLTYNFELPTGEYERFRMVWIDKNSGQVKLQFYDANGNAITQDGDPWIGDPITLNLTRIPFIMLDIGGSLLKDITKHQAALLNLGSSDVAYALKANFPFYTEQQDMRQVGDHLKHGVNPDGTAMRGGQRAMGRDVEVGTTQGRTYDLQAERPGFIHPSPEPLEASIRLQEKLEDDIRKLVNLAVANKTGRRVVSAEAMKMSDQGLEAGLSFIGLVLENGERSIANHWAAYENTIKSKRQIAVIKYPDRYTLKTDEDRVKEAEKLAELMYTVPSRTIKKELAKNIVIALLTGKLSVAQIEKIFKEIDTAEYATSDPDIIMSAASAGLVGEQVASMALGFDKDEYLQAREDHAARSQRILAAQTSGNVAARGVADLSEEPANEGTAEREEAVDVTLKTTTEKRVRGEGQGGV